MTRQDLENFVAVVERELGVAVSLPPPAERVPLPPPLAAFYALADGLDLPFIRIYPSSKVEETWARGWLTFGADAYFSYCLCRTSPPWELDRWDHESGNSPEGAYNDVIELLQASYDETWVEGREEKGHVVLEAIPRHVALATIVKQLKVLGAASSAALLAGLKRLPFELDTSNSADAIRVIRRLHARGVRCHWRAGEQGVIE